MGARPTKTGYFKVNYSWNRRTWNVNIHGYHKTSLEEDKIITTSNQNREHSKHFGQKH